MSKLINNEYLLKESTYSDFDTYQNTGYLLKDSSFLFAVNNSNKINVIQGSINNTTETLFNLLKENNEREKIYITAIKNLIKQKKYVNLIYELTNDLIDEDEFNFELNENESQYLIKATQKLDSNSKVENLFSVLNRIDENFNEEDLMEVFSITDAFVLKNIIFNNTEKNNCYGRQICP